MSGSSRSGSSVASPAGSSCGRRVGGAEHRRPAAGTPSSSIACEPTARLPERTNQPPAGSSPLLQPGQPDPVAVAHGVQRVRPADVGDQHAAGHARRSPRPGGTARGRRPPRGRRPGPRPKTSRPPGGTSTCSPEPVLTRPPLARSAPPHRHPRGPTTVAALIVAARCVRNPPPPDPGVGVRGRKLVSWTGPAARPGLGARPGRRRWPGGTGNASRGDGHAGGRRPVHRSAGARPTPAQPKVNE